MGSEDEKTDEELVREIAGEGPLLVLKPEQVLCPLHMEPFREKWPEGFPSFMVFAMEKIGLIVPPSMGSIPAPRPPGGFLEKAPKRPDGTVLPLSQALAWASLQFDEKPLCCRFSKQDLFKLYLKSREWKRATCEKCHEGWKKGCVYRLSDRPGGEVKTIDHLCFQCVVWKVARAEGASGQ